ncbi:MAG: 30S ribosomal protein S17 [Bdellovibrionales bacterium RIFOXYD12_FULL_39_22]|nr:MAG: 30S ribosomal protein S17 [Bdellovibrionales bacterium RIFOXYB1_FULL_39_21]OFZ43374.1 MAG: 30S ribosomal protein S17 [Bdellovibrionales bacterium RIFOXYC12_FULL_39_17]OFZ47401.1 MAG: 30S ribosomal protein S17 [Bdellovibrionales bacterium RIFOXYC1_FULL_39_130]OFZ73856.1 MAG: 30S ribosomal protein S17 [Bdellovibrionales bacterium RIFOXYC2_FULL_39_8]OFZ76281.1 MAG: 30S ribosomal protein S17 [Bdellovibrionales bacterium RIFOXYD1_FULL_39_84]OFZ94319.1 MAG: 30S ribosomal protein S17 [Bdellov
MVTANEAKKFKRKLTGVVVSDKPNKTVVVNVSRKFMHAKYSKFIQQDKKYHAHDENNSAKTGDKVVIIESRPHSKMKKWELLKIL